MSAGGSASPASPARKSITTATADSDDEDEDDDKESVDGDEKWDDVAEALTIIERDSVLTPTEVINILSQNPQLPFSICYDYMRRTMQAVQR